MDCSVIWKFGGLRVAGKIQLLRTKDKNTYTKISLVVLYGLLSNLFTSIGKLGKLGNVS